MFEYTLHTSGLDLEKMQQVGRETNIAPENTGKTGIFQAMFGITAEFAKKNQHEVEIMLVLLNEGKNSSNTTDEKRFGIASVNARC